MNERLDRADFAKRPVDWVFLEIRDIDTDTERVVSTVGRIAEKYGADCRMFGSLILMTLGTLLFESPWEGRPQEMVGALSQAFGSTAKILYGSSIGHCGFLGVRRLHHALLTPQLTEARQHVGSLDWGQVIEFQTQDHG